MTPRNEALEALEYIEKAIALHVADRSTNFHARAAVSTLRRALKPGDKGEALKYFNALWASIEKHVGVDPECAHWPEVIRAALAQSPGDEHHKRPCDFDKFGRCKTEGCTGAYTETRLCNTPPPSAEMPDEIWAWNYHTESYRNRGWIETPFEAGTKFTRADTARVEELEAEVKKIEELFVAQGKDYDDLQATNEKMRKALSAIKNMKVSLNVTKSDWKGTAMTMKLIASEALKETSE